MEHIEDHDRLGTQKTSSYNSGSNNGITDEGLDLQFDVGNSTESSEKDSSECVSHKIEVPELRSLPEDDALLKYLNFGSNYKELNAGDFKELAGKSGFQFGECFSLIEYAWSAKAKALARIKIPKAIFEELSMYVIHPCIIDASLQSCIAIGSTEPERNVIPIGL